MRIAVKVRSELRRGGIPDLKNNFGEVMNRKNEVRGEKSTVQIEIVTSLDSSTKLLKVLKSNTSSRAHRLDSNSVGRKVSYSYSVLPH